MNQHTGLLLRLRCRVRAFHVPQGPAGPRLVLIAAFILVAQACTPPASQTRPEPAYSSPAAAPTAPEAAEGPFPAPLEPLVKLAKSYCHQSYGAGLDPAARQDMERACGNAIRALALADAPRDQVEAALRQLAEGNDRAARSIFEQLLAQKSPDRRDARRQIAAAARDLGALAFKDDTHEAITYYQQAVLLDPDEPEGWNALGHLMRRIGALDQAAASYRRVQQLAQ